MSGVQISGLVSGMNWNLNASRLKSPSEGSPLSPLANGFQYNLAGAEVNIDHMMQNAIRRSYPEVETHPLFKLLRIFSISEYFPSLAISTMCETGRMSWTGRRL